MGINSADSAREWLRAWGGRPRRGILAEVLRGLKMCAGIMQARRYSDEQREDMAGAIAVLEAVRP